MGRNRLDKETSPYLQQHSDNPVHWQPWGSDALLQAKRENKPILLSSGYSACHWCHVMARESFEDTETAALMNKLFVNIKVDREERPDIDTIYQAALDKLGQPRGWPLTMFLTSDGEPFAGGTYYPPTPVFGRPAFREVLQKMADSYTNDPEKAAEKAARLISELDGADQNKGAAEVPIALRNHVANQLLDNVDIVYGGLGADAKFPQPMLQELLWRAYCRTGHGGFRKAVILSLEHMCQGGIYDHLGGGFARYTVDDRWLVPHFEKMLYDNALLIDLLTLLWGPTGSPLFAQRVSETIDWVLGEMATDEGGFASALAADSLGHGSIAAGEGAYYVWLEEEIDAVLGDESAFFKSYYDVGPQGNWKGKTILNRIDKPFGKDAAVEARLAGLRAKLLAARDERPGPIRDDKVLADWNGLMIAALASSGRSFDRPEWIAAARKAYDFLRSVLGREGRLLHGYRNGQATTVAILDDYSNMAHAALSLFEATGNIADLRQAEAWVAIADEHYWDEDGGGYYLTADDAESVVVRSKSAHDASVPSGNSMMVAVLARLYAFTGEDSYRQRAANVISTFSGGVAADFIAMATLMNNSELLHGLIQVIIIGDADATDTRRLTQAAYETAEPNLLVLQVPPGATLPDRHPAAGKAQIDGGATAYVCHGNTCQLPVTDPGRLRAMFEQD